MQDCFESIPPPGIAFCQSIGSKACAQRGRAWEAALSSTTEYNWLMSTGRHPFLFIGSNRRLCVLLVLCNVRLQRLLVGVWEWASTIPHQLFIPPTWIAATELGTASEALFRRAHLRFHQVLRTKAEKSPACKTLADEWGPDRPKGTGLPLASIRRNPGRLLPLYDSSLYPTIVTRPWNEAVLPFLGGDGGHGDGLFSKDVQRRIERAERYVCCLAKNDLSVLEPEPQKTAECEKKQAGQEKVCEPVRIEANKVEATPMDTAMSSWWTPISQQV